MSRWSELFFLQPDTLDTLRHSDDSTQHSDEPPPIVSQSVHCVRPQKMRKEDEAEEGAGAADVAHSGSLNGPIQPTIMEDNVAADGERQGLTQCAGCGEPIRPEERVYDYYDPQHGPQVVARCHSENLACLIAWNERWHAAEGHEYDADFYRRDPEGEMR